MDAQESIPHWMRSRSFSEEILRVQSTLTTANIPELADHYAERTPYFALLTYIRYCTDNPAQVIKRYSTHISGLHVSFSKKDQKVGIIELGSQSDSRCIALIWQGAGPNTWLIATDAKPSSRAVIHGLDLLLDKLAPLIVGGWVSTAQLTDLLKDLEASTSCRLRPSRAASRARGRSTVDWLQASSLKSVTSELSSRRAYLQSLSFRLVQESASREALNASVSRFYRTSFRGGSFYVFNRYLLTPMALLLSEQAGAIDFDHVSTPAEELRFHFDSRVLGDRESHERLLDVIARLPRLSVSASHLNPYMQLSVVDYEDGSILDLFSSDPSHLAFLPGRRCSSASILRISNQLYSEFAPGKLEKARPTSEDAVMGFGE